MVLLITSRSTRTALYAAVDSYYTEDRFRSQGNFYANLFVHFIPVDPDDPSKNHPDIDFGWTSTASCASRSEEGRGDARKLAAYPKPDSHEAVRLR